VLAQPDAEAWLVFDQGVHDAAQLSALAITELGVR